MSISVVTCINIYEKDGSELTGTDLPQLNVQSHWNRSSMVVLGFEDKRLTVSVEDLRKAITNASNI